MSTGREKETPESSRHPGGTPVGPVGSPWNRRVWPILIILGLLVVFLVNGLFVYIAVKGADQVVPSYFTEER